MEKAVLMTQAEYAKHRGCSAMAVSKAVKAGRISLTNGKIDPKKADLEWQENSVVRHPNAGSEKPAPEASAAAPDAVPPVGTPGYAAARARREVAEAEKAEIELRRLTGELVAYEDVLRGGFEAARDVRDTMTAAERELAAELASVKSPEACLELLRRHHRAVCEALVRGWREKIGPPPAGGLL